MFTQIGSLEYSVITSDELESLNVPSDVKKVPAPPSRPEYNHACHDVPVSAMIAPPQPARPFAPWPAQVPPRRVWARGPRLSIASEMLCLSFRTVVVVVM
ncbi:hypothetical protein P8C59_006604 [Phyllachora maydis]|uniref:Uncharacterized protein n=1 Tax=Phyllachora maydis TaxID=1825666 RepID=A0AAD9I6T5_9PEZI|nr:hypothetical protein P8C59_006604 [Phyllachora maydis]